MSFVRISLWLALGGLPLAATQPQVSPSGESRPLTLAMALARALENNPALQVHQLGPRVAEARVLQAGIRPNPELGLEFENALGTGANTGIKSLQTTLQLSQIVDLGGTIDRRVDAARSEHDVATATYETRRIDTFALVARRFVEVAAEQALLEQAETALALGRAMLDAAEERAASAQVSRLEVNQARSLVARLEIEREHAEHELAGCRQYLAAALGESRPTFGVIDADLLNLPMAPEFGVLAARLEQSPVLARWAAEERWQAARERLAASLRRSPAVISAGLRRNEATDDFGLVAGFSVPMGWRDPAAGSRREAQLQQELARAEAVAARLELRATLYDVYQEMVHARTAIDTLQEVLVPTAEDTLALVEDGYRRGRYALPQLQAAQQALLAHHTALVRQATAYQLHVIEIERLLGGPLDASGPAMAIR